MEKEKPKSKSKRIRTDRVRVRCSCCQLELNKDGISDHYLRKHPTKSKEEQKYEVVVDPSQQTLDHFKKKIFVKDADASSDLQSPSLVGAASKQKPKTFFNLPGTKSPSINVEEFNKDGKKEQDVVLKQVTGKKEDISQSLKNEHKEDKDKGQKIEQKEDKDKSQDKEQKEAIEKSHEKEQNTEQERVKKLLRIFDPVYIGPVLNRLGAAKSVNEQEQILKPFENDLQELQQLSITRTPVKWNTSMKTSYKDKTIPENLKDKIGVAYAGAGGDCQFKAVSMSLYGTERFHLGMRLLIVKELVENKPGIEAIAKNVFAEKNFDSIYNRVISHGKLSGWGNETTKYILSHVLQRPIVVTQTNTKLKEKAWVECRNVRFNANPSTLEKTPIHLLLSEDHYDPILRKDDGERFVDINKCHNMHPRLSKGFTYIKPGTDEDKQEVISLNTLTKWKNVTQWEEFQNMQDLKRQHLVKKGMPKDTIASMLKEDEEFFYIHLSENQTDVPKGEDSTIDEGKDREPDPFQQGKRKRSPDSNSSITSTLEDNNLLSPDKLSVHTEEESNINEGDKMSVDEEKESFTQQSFEMRLINVETGVMDIRRLLQDFVLDESRKPLNLENTKPVRRLDTAYLENVASVDALMAACPWLIKYKEEGVEDDFSGVRCTLCFTAASTSTKKEGQFSYPSSNGTDFREQTQPPKFRNLKSNLNRHALNARHRELAEMQATLNKMTLKQRERKIAMTLGSLAYEAIKVDHSYESYEGKVAAAAARGEDVGDLNHGKDFCRKFSDSLYQTLQKRIKTKLETPLLGTKRRPSFSYLGDKYTATPTRSAGQIVGILSYADGKIVDIMAEDKKVRDWKGLSLARDMVSSVATLIPEDIQKQRCVGGCFDGQYLHDRVHTHLMTDMPGKEEDKHIWYSFEWDPAHLIELGIKDGKAKLLKSAALTNVHKLVYQVNKMFTTGKSYVEMQEVAEEHDQRLYAPIQSSPTRFANNEHKTLLNFSRNYNLIRHRFAEENVIQQIEHFGFVASLNFQIDMYNEISKLSGSVQQPGKPSWRVEAHVKQTIETMREMVESLPDSKSKMFELSKNLPNLAKAVKEMEETQTYRGTSVIYSKVSTRGSRSADSQLGDSATSDIPTVLNQIRAEATCFLDAFENGYHVRKTKYKASASAYTSNLTEEAFSLENMLAHFENKNVPKEYMEYFQLAKKVGFIDTELDDLEVQHQYRRLTCFVKHQYDKAVSVRPALAEDQENLEQRIYAMVFDTDHEDEMDVAADLYLSALLRTRAESVAECMGSIVKAVSDNRPNLRFEQLSREAFLCYNGPQTYGLDAVVMIRLSVDRYFIDNTQSGEIHCIRKTTQLSKLQDWDTSRVVDNKRKEAEDKSKVSFRK